MTLLTLWQALLGQLDITDFVRSRYALGAVRRKGRTLQLLEKDFRFSFCFTFLPFLIAIVPVCICVCVSNPPSPSGLPLRFDSAPVPVFASYVCATSTVNNDSNDTCGYLALIRPAASS